MFLTISYLSSASDQLKDEDIQALMTETRAFNNANNIKGVLIYSDKTFFQIIEGEYDRVKSLFRKILKDSRHHAVLKILERKSIKRQYVRFTNNFITYNSEQANQDLLKFLDKNRRAMNNDNLHNLILYESKMFKK